MEGEAADVVAGADAVDEAEIEVLARRLDDAFEQLADALLELDVARGDAAAARADADQAERVSAVCRELWEAMRRAKEAEGPSREQFTWDECRARHMALSEAYVRARSFFTEEPLGGTTMIRVAAVVALLEPEGAGRAAIDAAVSLDDACARLSLLVKQLR